MKIEVSDELLGRFKRIIKNAGFDIPENDDEWTDLIKDTIEYRIDWEFSGIEDV